MNSTYRNTYTKSKDIVSKLRYNYRMGFDGTSGGTTLINSPNVKIFNSGSSASGEWVMDGSSYITPFAVDTGFTLVIDY